MADKPRTERPCLHLTDEDGDNFQIHHRGDGKMGFTLALLHQEWGPGPAPGLATHTLVELGFYITPGQAQELLAFLKENV